jgi:phosphopantetheinyl transferase (holo-ACP synthase)
MPALGARVASRSRALDLPESQRLGDLLSGCPAKLVFSNAEQRLCHRRKDLTGWGGRLAAKLAVCDLLSVAAASALAEHRDIGLSQLEILPEPHGLCGQSASCFKPHPPQVRLGPRWTAIVPPESFLSVSISHTSRLAIALAVVSGTSLAEGR